MHSSHTHIQTRFIWFSDTLTVYAFDQSVGYDEIISNLSFARSFAFVLSAFPFICHCEWSSLAALWLKHIVDASLAIPKKGKNEERRTRREKSAMKEIRGYAYSVFFFRQFIRNVCILPEQLHEGASTQLPPYGSRARNTITSEYTTSMPHTNRSQKVDVSVCLCKRMYVVHWILRNRHYFRNGFEHAIPSILPFHSVSYSSRHKKKLFRKTETHDRTPKASACSVCIVVCVLSWHCLVNSTTFACKEEKLLIFIRVFSLYLSLPLFSL